MEQIPDAPWIREAERDGVPADDPIKCPICGDECDTIYMDKYGEVFGCEQCITKTDAWLWADDQRGSDYDS